MLARSCPEAIPKLKDRGRSDGVNLSLAARRTLSDYDLKVRAEEPGQNLSSERGAYGKTGIHETRRLCGGLGSHPKGGESHKLDPIYFCFSVNFVGNHFPF